jgi:hypothetical protein
MNIDFLRNAKFWVTKNNTRLVVAKGLLQREHPFLINIHATTLTQKT